MSLTIHTNVGDVKIGLYCEEVPLAAYNFLALCASGYYDGTVFHRNIPGFLIQGGDPTGTGKGGQSIYGDYFQDEFVTELKHDKRGCVSMANKATQPNTNGSQFFITYAAASSLDNKNVVIGKVLEGLDILDKLERVPTNKDYKPIHTIKIENITIHANPIADQM